MKYSEEPNEKHVRKMRVMSQALGLNTNVFKPEEWLKQETFSRLVEILDNEWKYAATTARNYLTSVCFFLKKAGHTRTIYHDEVSRRGKAIPVPNTSTAVTHAVSLQALQGIANNGLKPKTVRALAAMILAGDVRKIRDFKDLTVQDVLDTIQDESLRRTISNIYLNSHSKAFLLGATEAPITPAVTSTLFSRITGAPYKSWSQLTVASQKQASAKPKPTVSQTQASANPKQKPKPVVSQKQASDKPKQKPKPVVSQKQASDKPKPVVSQKQASDKPKPKPVVSQKQASDKPKQKPKPVVSQKQASDKPKPVVDIQEQQPPAKKPKKKSNIIAWSDTIPEDTVRQQTKELHVRQVRKLQENALAVSADTGMDWKAFNTLNAYYRVMAYLESPTANKGKPFSAHTKRSYLSSLCKLLSAVEEFNASIFSKYSRSEEEYQHAIDAAGDESNAGGRGTIDFEAYIPKLRSTVRNKKVIPYVRVLCAWIISDLDDNNQPDNLNGVLRPSDLMETRFVDDGKHNYLDMANKRWFIRGTNTKNGVTRTLQVERFCDYLNEIYGSDKPDYLLVNRKGRKMEHSYASANFKTVVGVPYTQFRKAYYDFRNKKGIRQAQLTVLSRNMGHAPKTAITVYQQV
jgi:hypothetical protein